MAREICLCRAGFAGRSSRREPMCSNRALTLFSASWHMSLERTLADMGGDQTPRISLAAGRSLAAVAAAWASRSRRSAWWRSRIAAMVGSACARAAASHCTAPGVASGGTCENHRPLGETAAAGRSRSRRSSGFSQWPRVMAGASAARTGKRCCVMCAMSDGRPSIAFVVHATVLQVSRCVA